MKELVVVRLPGRFLFVLVTPRRGVSHLIRGLNNNHLSAAGSPTATMVRLRTSQLVRSSSRLRFNY